MSYRGTSIDISSEEHYTSSASPHLQAIAKLEEMNSSGSIDPDVTDMVPNTPIGMHGGATVQFPRLPTPPIHHNHEKDEMRGSFETKRRSRTMSLSEQTRAAAQKIAPPVSFSLVFLCLLWYLTSAISSNLSKAILSEFAYPICLTLAQFIYAFVFGVLTVIAADRHPRVAAIFPKGTVTTQGLVAPSKYVAMCTAPMAGFQIAGHILTHSATSAIPVSLVHAIKALSPLFTVIAYAGMFGVRYNNSTYISLIPLTVGVIMTCAAQFKAKPLAILNAIMAALIFVSQNIYSKGLLTTGSPSKSAASSDSATINQPKLDKLTILYWCAAFGFIGTLPIWLVVDGPKIARRGLVIAGDASPTYIAILYTLNGIAHFTQNLLSFMILGSISPVAYSIASLLKRIVVITVAIIWFGQRVSSSQGWGIVMTFTGLYIYDRFGSKTPPVEQSRSFSLPS